MLPFRNPQIVDALLSDNRQYNVFFVCSHGSLIPDNPRKGTKGQFNPPDNTILVYTGAGKPGLPITSNKAIEKEIMHRFDPSKIKETFAAFLGLWPEGNRDLLYKVPNDRLPSPELSLTIAEADRARNIGFWGVYRHTGQESGRRNFKNIEEMPELTAALRGRGTFASTLTEHIHATYKHRTNIVCFISCRNALRYTDTRIANYSLASAPFFADSHFAEVAVPSGLNAHVPSEDQPFHTHTVHFIGYRWNADGSQTDVVIPMAPQERNILVSEFLAKIQQAHVFQGRQGLYLSTHAKPYLPLENDVLLESQLHESYFDKKDGHYFLRIYPNAELDPEPKKKLMPGYFHPNNLETHEVIRRGKAMRNTRKTTNRR
jgi:hypothetical protein